MIIIRTLSEETKKKSQETFRRHMYEKAEKEIGNKYYHLTIIGINYEETEKHNYNNNGERHGVYFDFECDCENKTKITRRFNTVKTGHTMSCGCSKFNNPKNIEEELKSGRKI